MKWLSVFRYVVQSGTVQGAAEATGQSISAVSNQLKALEAHLGVPLMDHSRRPMVPTAQGLAYLRTVEEVLGLLDSAQAEMNAASPNHLMRLRFAMIDDFETDIGPEITRMLAAKLPDCQFIHLTRVSHEILDLLRTRDLDMGMATQPQTPLPNAVEFPVLRDPFVLAVPAGMSLPPEAFLDGSAGVPFLRYNRAHILGSIIEAQLVRLRLDLETSFEFDSTSSILALIAQGDGWAITTPSNYARTRRFQSDVRLIPFPRKGFARRISIFVADPQAEEVARSVASAVRSLLVRHRIAPTVEAYPWLQDSYRLIDG